MNHEVACAIGFGIAKLISYLFMQFIQKVQMLGRSESIRKLLVKQIQKSLKKITWHS